MRFHYGAVPDNPDFRPQEQGWHSIREPGPWLVQLIALPVSVVLLAISAGLLYLVLPLAQLLAEPEGFSVPLWLIVLILVLIIPLHEFIHAFVHPKWGSSSKTVIGFWLSRLLFYAHYEGEMSRNRFLLVFAAPYLVLSLLPVLVILLLRWIGSSGELMWGLAFLSVVGGALSSGDAVGFCSILLQIPVNARVRNKRWNTYWVPETENGSAQNGRR